MLLDTGINAGTTGIADLSPIICGIKKKICSVGTAANVIVFMFYSLEVRKKTHFVRSFLNPVLKSAPVSRCKDNSTQIDINRFN